MTTEVRPDWGDPARRAGRPALPRQRDGRTSAEGTSGVLGRLGLGVVHLLILIDVAAAVTATLVVGAGGTGLYAFVALVLGLNAAGGLYAPKLALSVLDQVPSLLGRALVAGALVTSLRVVTGSSVGTRILDAAAVFAVVAIGGRAAGYVLVRHLRRTGQVAHRTLILGAGRVGGWVGDVMRHHPEHGLRPVGFLDGDPLLSDEQLSLPVLGDMTQLSRILTEHEIRVVVVAFGADRESGIVDILRTCDRHSCEIFFVPRLYELQPAGAAGDHIWSLPLVRLSRAPFRSGRWRAKRVFDVAVAALALVLLAPVMAACAVAVRRNGGAVLFRQSRVGLDGREFKLLKFRTLEPADENESASNWSIARDDRLTAVGRFLRATSLDELPQLVNILRGDMSLVGPRPERPYFVEEFTERFPRYMSRHRVPAGLTGWAQVNGLRGDTSIEDRARFDNYYIENWSLWQDVKILLRTVAQVTRAGGG